MRSKGRKCCLGVGLCAVMGAASSVARGIIVWGGNGYNNSATTPAPDNLQNFEGYFQNTYSGTPISPNFVIAAAHTVEGPTEIFTYDNGTGTPTVYNMVEVATEDDMVLWEIEPNQSASFSTYTSVYTGNSEVNSPIVDLGEGYSRGSVISSVQGNQTVDQGWNWSGLSLGNFSWGENFISAIDEGSPGTAYGGDFLQYDFQNNPIYPNGVADTNECILSIGDSGGGVFIDVNGTWELAGVNYGFDGVTTDSAGKDLLYASLYNEYGYYSEDPDGTYTLVTNNSQYESSFATRLSSKTSLIDLADGAASVADANEYRINDDGIVDILQNMTTGAVIGGAALEVGISYATATMQIAPNSGTSWISSLSIVNNSKLDLTNNEIVITYTGSDPISTIFGYLKSGFNNGGWNGPGIISSEAQSRVNGYAYGVGWADGADGVVAGLSSGQIEVRFTLLGDANLDGDVNGSDFSILAANFGLGSTNWDQGNFLYTSSVNGADFAVLAENFGQGVTTGLKNADIAALDAFAVANGLTSDLPEPAAGVLLIATALGACGHRRRKPT